jgi:hypothetical protein
MKNKLISALYPFKKIHRLATITVIIGFCLSNVQGQIDQGMWMTRGSTYLYSSPHLDKPLFASYAELGYMLSNRFMLEPSFYSTTPLFWRTRPIDNLSLGLGLRYYYGAKKQKIAPFAGLKLDKEIYGEFYHRRTGRLRSSVGVDFFVHRNLAIEVNVFHHWQQIFGSRYDNTWGGDITLKTFIDRPAESKRKINPKKFESPITKGAYLLGGTMSMEGDNRGYGNFEHFAFQLQPRFGLALNRRWIVGLHPKFDFYYLYNDFYDLNTYFNRIWVGGFVRHVIPITPKRLVPFLELGYQWEVSLSATRANLFDSRVSDHVLFLKSHRWQGSVGVDYFIHPRIALEGSFTIDRDNVSFKMNQYNYLKFGVQAFVHKTDAASKKQKP